MARAKVAGLSPKVDPADVRRMKEIVRILRREYPEAKCSLAFETPFQLLVATMLSAQCTDERVNMTTPELFRRYPDALSMSKAPQSAVEKLVQSTGFFRNKAKAIRATSKILVEKYRGQVPQTLDELHALPGVGRKTANVVLGNAFGVPGVVVDTHVLRISKRLGFTQLTDPVKVEFALQPLLDPKDWTDFTHLIIHHGRAICTARKALCEECPLSRFCPKIGVTV